MTALRTVSLPSNRAAAWDWLAWEPKYAGDVLDYTLDCAAWLADAGRVIEVASVSLSPELDGGGLDYKLSGNGRTGVTLRIGGGTPGGVARVAFRLQLDDDRVLNAVVSLPIRDALPTGLVPLDPLDPRAIAVGGVPITVAGSIITV